MDLFSLMILALDIATHCGWATPSASGTWDFSIKRDESGGMRLIRFKSKLREIVELEGIKFVPYEAARASGSARLGSQGAIVVQSEMQGIMKNLLDELGVDYKGYSSTEIKKHATGKGNANKEKMMQAARENGWNPKDDNEADALWLLDLAQKEYGDVYAKEKKQSKKRTRQPF